MPYTTGQHGQVQQAQPIELGPPARVLQQSIPGLGSSDMEDFRSNFPIQIQQEGPMGQEVAMAGFSPARAQAVTMMDFQDQIPMPSFNPAPDQAGAPVIPIARASLNQDT